MPTCPACRRDFRTNEELEDHIEFDCDGIPADDNYNDLQESFDFDDADGAFIDSVEAYDNHDWNAAD